MPKFTLANITKNEGRDAYLYTGDDGTAVRFWSNGAPFSFTSTTIGYVDTRALLKAFVEAATNRGDKSLKEAISVLEV